MNNWAYFNEKYGEPIGAGAQCQVYRKDDTVYKVLSEGHLLYNALQEGYALAVAELLELPVSRIHGVYTEAGHIVMEMDYVKGEPLMNRILKAAAEDDTETSAAYLKRLALLLAQLHKKQAGGLQDTRKYYTLYLTLLPDVPETLRKNLHCLVEKLPDGTALCHNDFHAQNVMIDGDVCTVIDWDSATIGDAAGDAAHSYLATLLAFGEEGARIFLDEYMSLTGMTRERIEAWLPLHAFVLYYNIKAGLPEKAKEMEPFFTALT